MQGCSKELHNAIFSEVIYIFFAVTESMFIYSIGEKNVSKSHTSFLIQIPHINGIKQEHK